MQISAKGLWAGSKTQALGWGEVTTPGWAPWALPGSSEPAQPSKKSNFIFNSCLFQDKSPAARNASPRGFLSCCRLTGSVARQSFCCCWREKRTFVPELGFVMWDTLQLKTSGTLWVYKIKNGRKHSPDCSSTTYPMSPGQKKKKIKEQFGELEFIP